MQQDEHVGLSHKLQDVNRIIVSHIILFHFNGSSNKGFHRKGDAMKRSASLTWFSSGTLQLTQTQIHWCVVQTWTHAHFLQTQHLSTTTKNKSRVLLCFPTLKCVWWIYLSIKVKRSFPDFAGVVFVQEYEKGSFSWEKKNEWRTSLTQNVPEQLQRTRVWSHFYQQRRLGLLRSAAIAHSLWVLNRESL